MKKIAVINGPNLNLLGKREPAIYGSQTLQEIEADLGRFAKTKKVSILFFQSNSEDELITFIQGCMEKKCDLMIINAAALTHTSIGVRDACLATGIPVIEVHLSNIYKREAFRKESYLSDIAIGVICGFGPKGYELALEAACHHLGIV